MNYKVAPVYITGAFIFFVETFYRRRAMKMEFHKKIKYWRRHPSVMLEEVYGFKLYPWQKLYINMLCGIEKWKNRFPWNKF